MTTGCSCPSCPGVSPAPNTPCRDCEIDALPAGPERWLAEFMRTLNGGPSLSHEPEQFAREQRAREQRAWEQQYDREAS
jgi:hypothetical protein